MRFRLLEIEIFHYVTSVFVFNIRTKVCQGWVHDKGGIESGRLKYAYRCRYI